MLTLGPSSFDRKHLGKRGFVIGGGASIASLIDNGFDFRLLDKEITVAINQSFKLVNPTYITTVDVGFLGRNKGSFPANPDVRFLLTQMISMIPECQGRTILLKTSPKAKFPTNIGDPLPPINNSGAFGILLAYLLGLNPLYLLGFDGVKVDGKSHFHTDYPYWKLNSGQVRAMVDHCRKIIQVLLDAGITIYSCSSVSLLNDMISVVDIDKVLHGSTKFPRKV